MFESLIRIEGFLDGINVLLPPNIYIEAASKEQDVWYNSILVSSLLSFTLGVILTFFGEYFIFYYKERKELERYEYYLLSTTLDLLSKINEVDNPQEVSAIKTDFKNLLNDVFSDIRFFKLNSSQKIIDALKKGYQNKNVSEEIDQIKNQRNEIKNR
jgi:hypothetical protein